MALWIAFAHILFCELLFVRFFVFFDRLKLMNDQAIRTEKKNQVVKLAFL